MIFLSIDVIYFYQIQRTIDQLRLKLQIKIFIHTQLFDFRLF